MTTPNFLNDAIKNAAQQTDMNKVQTGGGGGAYEPPAKGLARLRFVGYIELGKQKHEWQGKVSYKEKVRLIFELSGPRHQPKENDEGEKFPHRMTIEENLSLNERAWFYKIFRAMNYSGEATHIAQLLGHEFIGEIQHKTSKRGNVYPTLKNDNGYTIRAPFVEDPETGETRKVPAGPQISETRCFLWDFASKEMWDSLYIDGEYPEKKDDKGNVVLPAKSKNVFQEAIMAAKNWEGSPMHELLEGAALDTGNEEDFNYEPADEQDGSETDEADPLAGVS